MNVWGVAGSRFLNNASLNMFLHVFWCKYHAFLLGVCMWCEIAFPKWVLPVLFPAALNQSSCCSVPSPGLLWGEVKNLPTVQETACNVGDMGLFPGLGRWIPWRRKWLSTPVFFPGKSRGRRSLVGYSPWGCESPTWLRGCKQPPYLHQHFSSALLINLSGPVIGVSLKIVVV